jgi:hypothetical protein
MNVICMLKDNSKRQKEIKKYVSILHCLGLFERYNSQEDISKKKSTTKKNHSNDNLQSIIDEGCYLFQKNIPSQHLLSVPITPFPLHIPAQSTSLS